MRSSIRSAVLAVAALGALALVSSAAAAYTTPTLKVTQVGSKTTIEVTQSQSDDSTAAASIYAPAGTVVTATQAPGTTLGEVKAQVTALALGGALLPLTGEINVAPPGAVAAEVQAACTQGQAPTATWLMVLQAAGQTLNVPMYVVTTAGAETAFGPAKIVVCLPPPDIPVEMGGATFGAKLFTATFSVAGVFSPVATGAWVAIWTPYQAGNGQVNPAASVASPAAIAPAAITVATKKAGKVPTRVTGTLTQAGQPLAGQRVEVWAGLKGNKLKRVKTVKTNAKGVYAAVYAKKALFFRTRAAAGARPAPPLCAALTALPVPCVNPTVNGFLVTSPIKKR
jgi:hypothetical protein